ncbi:hypothetical protein HDU82_003747, partial [Entophlyctis luteolus]
MGLSLPSGLNIDALASQGIFNYTAAMEAYQRHVDDVITEGYLFEARVNASIAAMNSNS